MYINVKVHSSVPDGCVYFPKVLKHSKTSILCLFLRRQYFLTGIKSQVLWRISWVVFLSGYANSKSLLIYGDVIFRNLIGCLICNRRHFVFPVKTESVQEITVLNEKATLKPEGELNQSFYDGDKWLSISRWSLLCTKLIWILF